MPLAFGSQERIDPLGLIRGEQAARGQRLATNAAPFMATAVDEGIARRTTPLAWRYADADEGHRLIAGNRAGLIHLELQPLHIQFRSSHNLLLVFKTPQPRESCITFR